MRTQIGLRNLLFLVVCVTALLVFKSSVFPAVDVEPRPTIGRDARTLRRSVDQIDAAFAESWQKQGLTPADPADDLTVVRRLSLALSGTIPSLEEIRRIERLPPDGRPERWMAELLADRRYADFTAERLARAYVGVDDGPFLLFRRRRFVSWLADQLATQKPYDQIVRHLISDSGLWTDTPATNFITVAIKPDEDSRPDANQLAARVSRAFLGVRIDCAECHDHPFEAWKQRDFQGMAAFFGQTRQSLRGIRDVPGSYQVEDRRTGQMETIICGVPFQQELLPPDGSRRKRLAAWVTHRDNRSFASESVNRAWALMFGRPLVAPIDDLRLGGEVPAALDILADDFVEHGFDWQRLLQAIASTRVFRLDSKLDSNSEGEDDTGEHERSWAVFPLTRLRPEQVVGAILQSASLATIDAGSHIVVRLAREIGQRDFIRRYGDGGSEEFETHGGTITQRLLMMNGQIVQDKTKDSLLVGISTQIAMLAPDDARAVETAMLAVLTRRPNEEERKYFCSRLDGIRGNERSRRVGDLVWTLLNSTEFSWNH